jgi:hypothetical protein
VDVGMGVPRGEMKTPGVEVGGTAGLPLLDSTMTSPTIRLATPITAIHFQEEAV